MCFSLQKCSESVSKNKQTQSEMTVARGISRDDALIKAGDAFKLATLIESGTVLVNKRNMGHGRKPRVRYEWVTPCAPRPPRPEKMAPPPLEKDESEDEEDEEGVAAVVEEEVAQVAKEEVEKVES